MYPVASYIKLNFKPLQTCLLKRCYIQLCYVHSVCMMQGPTVSTSEPAPVSARSEIPSDKIPAISVIVMYPKLPRPQPAHSVRVPSGRHESPARGAARVQGRHEPPSGWPGVAAGAGRGHHHGNGGGATARGQGRDERRHPTKQHQRRRQRRRLLIDNSIL